MTLSQKARPPGRETTGVTVGAVLFAAGRGRRLQPLTDRIPKPILPLLEVPLAAWGLHALTTAASPVVVNASHLAPRMIEVLERLPFRGWQPFVEEPAALGTAGTLHALRDRFGDRVVTSNADVVTDLSIAHLLECHVRSGATATVAVRSVERAADMRLDGDRVVGFVDRRRSPHEVGVQFLGVAVFERAALDLLPDHRPAGLGETLLATLVERGDLAAHLHEGYWVDVGTPAAYLSVSLDLLYGRAPVPPVAVPGTTLQVAGGLAYVGPKTTVDQTSLGAGAIVLTGAVVSGGATIERSIVTPGSVVPAGSNLRDTVWLGPGPGRPL